MLWPALAARAKLAHMLGEAGQLAQAAAQYRDLLADYLRVLGPDRRVAGGNLTNK